MMTSLVLLAAASLSQNYDLLIQGGHVIDPKNGINRRMDVAVKGGEVARVAESIPAAEARRVANAAGLYVTPGLIDIHVHVYAGTGGKALTGDSSVYPDGFSFRTGVTTMVDAGTSGWRNFPDFRQRVIDRAQTRVLALLNIVGDGMSPKGEDDAANMDPDATARMAKAHPDVVVGYKTAHYAGSGWPSIEGAVKAGRITDLPVMVDFGYVNHERNINTLFMDKLRPGDIYTHCYSTHRNELLDNGTLNPAMWAGRKRGILFDVGHGGGSFYWNVAIPAFKEKFYPDSISTDLHTGSMNAGMKDMATTMSKVLVLGVPLADVVKMSTWNPARQIKRPQLGNLDVGAEADIAVLRVETGKFGYLDSAGARYDGDRRISAEMTVRAGRVVYDLNGRAAPGHATFKYPKREAAPAAKKK
ncbi:MAG: amidohydrolase/deacetylase family metallohydrolase [Acidobacteria bacterium]|nr:amidohydrolase/deacetylase family metallohydrolase [Acidobacteriota bacterium]